MLDEQRIIPTKKMIEGIEVNGGNGSIDDDYDFEQSLKHDIDTDLQGIEPEVFDDLQQMGQGLKKELKKEFVNEFGEIEDIEVTPSSSNSNSNNSNNSNSSSNFEDIEVDLDGGTLIKESCSSSANQQFADPTIATTTSALPKRSLSWTKRSKISPNETDQEFELFTVFCNCGGGRSLTYISQLSNLQVNVITKIAQKNAWKLRAADYDRYVMAQKLKEAESARHERHMRKLESYRQQQETLGHQLSLNAARIAFLANKKLSSMLDSEQDIDLRDMPSLLNTASKLAEVGKNLQSSALGVDQLLAAIEEAEID